MKNARGIVVAQAAIALVACGTTPKAADTTRARRAGDAAVAPLDAGAALLAPDAATSPSRPPRPTPDVAQWSELGVPELIAHRRGSWQWTKPYVFPAEREGPDEGPEPFGVVVATEDKLAVWTPSHATPIATREISAELARDSRSFSAIAGGHGLLVVENGQEILGLDSETLVTRWRYALAPQERSPDWLHCAITADLVVLEIDDWVPGTPPKRGLVGIDHSGVVRFRRSSPAGFPMTSANGLYVGGDRYEGIVALDASGNERWRIDAPGPYVLAGENAVAERGGLWRVFSGATGAEIQRGAPPTVGASPGELARGAADGGVLYSIVESKATDGISHVAFAAWDTSSCKTLWSTRERVSFGMMTGDLQITRGEILYVDREDDELVAIDKTTHGEKWSWPTADAKFVFANDGKPAIYAESHGQVEGDVPTVIVFRPGKAEPMTLVHVTGRVSFNGKPVSGVAVRARTSFTRTSASGAFAFDVRARGAFTIAASARAIGPKPCRTARGAGYYVPGQTSHIQIGLASDCDQSDE